MLLLKWKWKKWGLTLCNAFMQIPFWGEWEGTARRRLCVGEDDRRVGGWVWEQQPESDGEWVTSVNERQWVGVSGGGRDRVRRVARLTTNNSLNTFKKPLIIHLINGFLSLKIVQNWWFYLRIGVFNLLIVVLPVYNGLNSYTVLLVEGSCTELQVECR